MKTTIDVPDDLYRDVKAEAARRGLTVREVTTNLYKAWLADRPPVAMGTIDQAAVDAYLRRLDEIAAIVASGPELIPDVSALEQLRRDRDARG